MCKVIITGVDGNFGSHAAKTILKKMDRDGLMYPGLRYTVRLFHISE